jgi:hypothetical protein
VAPLVVREAEPGASGVDQVYLVHAHTLRIEPTVAWGQRTPVLSGSRSTMVLAECRPKQLKSGLPSEDGS